MNTLYLYNIVLVLVFCVKHTISIFSLNCSTLRQQTDDLQQSDEPSSVITFEDAASSANICMTTRVNGTCCPSSVRISMLKGTTAELKKVIDKINSQLVAYVQEKRRQLKDHLIAHLAISESKMHEMFEENFQTILPVVRSPVQNLFKTFRSYVRSESIDKSIRYYKFNEAKFEKSVDKFYSFIFDPIYACVMTQNCPRVYSLKSNYSDCIRESYDYIKPFGNAAALTSLKLKKQLKLANATLQVLDEFSDFLNSTSKFLWNTDKAESVCQTKLYQLYYCSFCYNFNNDSGRAVCPSVLTQTLEICLSNFKHFDYLFVKIIFMLRSALGAFINDKQFEVEENLINLNDDVLNVILNSTLKGGPEISSRVYERCGPVQNELQNAQNAKKQKSMRAVKRLNDLRIQSIGNSRFTHMASTVLQDLSALSIGWFSRTLVKVYEKFDVSTNANEPCWNGHTFVRFSKSLEALGTGVSSHRATDQSSSLTNTDLDERYKRLSETLQSLEKFKDDEQKLEPSINKHFREPQASSLTLDEGSGDFQNQPVITDDDDYSPGFPGSGDGPVVYPSSGDTDDKKSRRIMDSGVEVALENVSTAPPAVVNHNAGKSDGERRTTLSGAVKRPQIATILFILICFYTMKRRLLRTF